MLDAAAEYCNFELYEQRNPKASQYDRCVEGHFEELEMAWDDCYARMYGFWRPYVRQVIYRYLDCGDLHFGFARIRCTDCGHEYLLSFSCKRRHFCPSCHQKRVIEFGQWLCEDVLKSVPHRQWVFSIPKRLRIYFMLDRSLLAGLSRCAWKVVSLYLKLAVPYEDAMPGAVIAVQSFGDFQNFHPHLHLLATDGCFNNNGAFMVCPSPKTDDLEEFFRYEVFKLLRAEGKISDAVIENMMGWRHSGFNVFCGPTIWPRDEKGLENLSRFIIRASFSQERMLYIPAHDSPDGTAKVIYTSKDAKTSKTFHALDWLAQLVTHIPNRGEQMVRYYGFHSNRARGDRKKMGKDDELPALMAPEVSSTQLRRSWARLIQKIYHVDPLICPKCRAKMKIIAFIDAGDVIEKILRHLGLWQTHNHDPPLRKASHIPEFIYDDDYCQVPPVDYWLQ